MRKKLIIGILVVAFILLAAVIFLLVSISMNINNNKHSETELNTENKLEDEEISDNKNENEGDSDNKNESTNYVNKSKYESDYVILADSFEDKKINGKVIDVVNIGSVTYILTNENKIYYHSLLEDKYILTANDNFKNIFSNTSRDTLVIENKNNTYSVYDVKNTEKNYTIKAENLITAYWKSETLSVITLENEILYYAWYKKVDGVWKSDKGQLIIDESAAKGQNDGTSLYNGKIKYAEPSETHLAVVRNDGTTYYLNLSVYDKIMNNGYEFDTIKGYKLINNVDKIYADGNIQYYLKPFYSTNSDEKYVYVRTGNISSSYTTTKIVLPNKYTTSNINKICSAVEEILVIMDDGNVLYRENAFYDSSWAIVQELTTLNKQSHIVKIVDADNAFYILCDDGYLYNYKK